MEDELPDSGLSLLVDGSMSDSLFNDNAAELPRKMNSRKALEKLEQANCNLEVPRLMGA